MWQQIPRHVVRSGSTESLDVGTSNSSARSHENPVTCLFLNVYEMLKRCLAIGASRIPGLFRLRGRNCRRRLPWSPLCRCYPSRKRALRQTGRDLGEVAASASEPTPIPEPLAGARGHKGRCCFSGVAQVSPDCIFDNLEGGALPRLRSGPRACRTGVTANIFRGADGAAPSSFGCGLRPRCETFA
jgi:hypothetical protein